MDTTSIDSSLIVSIVIAVVAIVPGVWALVNQANKDKNQARMDMNKAAQDAAMNIIAPLQAEVTRLQVRVIELEKALIDKTTEIGSLMQAGIDKDSEIRTLKYGMLDMQKRLNVFETKRNKVKQPETEVTEESLGLEQRLEDDLKSDEAKKEEIKQYTLKSIEQFSNGSLINLQTKTEMEE
jgi:hypothetical protein